MNEPLRPMTSEELEHSYITHKNCASWDRIALALRQREDAIETLKEWFSLVKEPPMPEIPPGLPNEFHDDWLQANTDILPAIKARWRLALERTAKMAELLQEWLDSKPEWISLDLRRRTAELLEGK